MNKKPNPFGAYMSLAARVKPEARSHSAPRGYSEEDEAEIERRVEAGETDAQIAKAMRRTKCAIVTRRAVMATRG